jgi:hypothetical protein
MSKLNTPQEKKLVSLAMDRRNVYGENAKSSRKNVPRSKQIAHQALRRAANQPLLSLRGQVDEDTAAAADIQGIVGIIERKRKGFAKSADAPLGMLLESKQTGNWLKTNRAYWLPNRKPRTGS